MVYNTRLVDGEITRGCYQNFFQDGEKVETYRGDMSKGARARLQEACKLMIAVTPKKWYDHPDNGKRLSFRIGLLTVTLSAPQGELSDRDVKKGLLEPYLRKLRKYGLRNYIWKAERQQNGNIHFHIFTDCFIDHNDARNIWNRLQANFHFINSFEGKHGHRDPNSTDIKAIHTDNGMIRYMLKYMVKDVVKSEQLEMGRKVSNADVGKIWDCSKALKETNPTAEFSESGEYELIETGMAVGELREVKTDFCYIYFFSGENFRDYIPPKVEQRYTEWLLHVRQLSV